MLPLGCLNNLFKYIFLNEIFDILIAENFYSLNKFSLNLMASGVAK